jgi:hypothetical protein
LFATPVGTYNGEMTPSRVVICTLGGDRRPWELPASEALRPTWIHGGVRSLHELAVAIATTGRTVELRGMVFKDALDELAAAAGARPATGLKARRPTADDLVIVPEGWGEPLAYARVAFSAASPVLLMLAPPGLFGWPFVSGRTPPSPISVPLNSLARPEHFHGMAALRFELWSGSHGVAEAARSAGVECTWIGHGNPSPISCVADKTIDVVWLEDNRWAPLAREVAARLDVPHRSIRSNRHHAVLQELGAGRVLLWPSRVEGHARILNEARSLGTVPVALATNRYATGLTEAAGCAVVDTLEELPGAIHKLLRETDRLAELSSRGITAAREEVNWSAYVSRVDAAVARERADPSRSGWADIGRRIDEVWGAAETPLLHTLSKRLPGALRRTGRWARPKGKSRS